MLFMLRKLRPTFRMTSKDSIGKPRTMLSFPGALVQDRNDTSALSARCSPSLDIKFDSGTFVADRGQFVFLGDLWGMKQRYTI